MTQSIPDVQSSVHNMLKKVGLFPRGVQLMAIERGLLDGRSVMVCSPTGSGKTLIGEMALLRAISVGKRGIFLVPLKALATQVADILHERYDKQGVRVGLTTGDFQLDGSDLEPYDIVVSTFERMDSLLRHNTNWLTEVGTLVIDEVQTIAENGRGSRLESVIIRMKKLAEDHAIKLQIVALSATTGMPEQLAEWLGCELVESQERPVPLNYKVIVGRDRAKAIRRLAMTTVQRDGQVLIFHRTRKSAELEAQRLAEDVGRQLTNEERAQIRIELNSLENWEVTLPKGLTMILHDGTAFHHAGLSSKARNLVEKMFLKGSLRVICATTTLAAGIDLPARAVILTHINSPGNYSELLSPNKVHQMLGRAGRPGCDRIGFGMILVSSSGEKEKVKQKYFKANKNTGSGVDELEPKYEALVSMLDRPSALTEQLLVMLDFAGKASLEEIENELFGESFLSFCSGRFSNTPMRILHLGDINAETAIEKHAFQVTIRAARQGVIGTVTLRELGKNVIGGLVSETRGNQFTCRYSARVTDSGLLEGPMCSCGKPIDKGILCPHLIALGIAAANHASATIVDNVNYIIPLSLEESSPSRTLIKLGLVEGADGGKLKPTKLGRIVNRLYLSIPAIRELIAFLSEIKNSEDLLKLLSHLVGIETGIEVDDAHQQLVAMLITTTLPVRNLAKINGLQIGDAYSFLDSVKWILHSIGAVAEHSGLVDITGMARQTLGRINKRLHGSKGDESGSD